LEARIHAQKADIMTRTIPILQRLKQIVLLLSLLNYEPYSTKAWDEEGFLKSCSSQRCSKHGPDIRFPFRLSTHDPSCGMPGMQLSCSGHDTILDHPVLGSCKVTAIYYRYRVINAILLVESSSNCPLQKLASTNVSTAVYEPQKKDGATIVGCSKDSIATNQDGIVGPRSCLNLSSHGSQLWYLVPPRTYMSALPPDCTVVAKGIPIPFIDAKERTQNCLMMILVQLLL
jgi:hypothetical protein